LIKNRQYIAEQKEAKRSINIAVSLLLEKVGKKW
jgi:hypothetical protein